MLKISRTLFTCLKSKQKQVFRINELPKAFLKTSSSLTVMEIPKYEKLHPGKDWNVLYALPEIKLLYIISRLKIIVPAVMIGIVAPACLACEYFEHAPAGSGISFFLFGTLNAISLALVTLPFKDAIGLVHIKKDQSEIMISSFDFWGNPKKTFTSPENIKLILPKYDLEKKIFSKFQIGDEGNQVKIIKIKALVTDYETFTNIFGYDALTNKK